LALAILGREADQRERPPRLGPGAALRPRLWSCRRSPTELADRHPPVSVTAAPRPGTRSADACPRRRSPRRRRSSTNPRPRGAASTFRSPTSPTRATEPPADDFEIDARAARAACAARRPPRSVNDLVTPLIHQGRVGRAAVVGEASSIGAAIRGRRPSIVRRFEPHRSGLHGGDAVRVYRPDVVPAPRRRTPSTRSAPPRVRTRSRGEGRRGSGGFAGASVGS